VLCKGSQGACGCPGVYCESSCVGRRRRESEFSALLEA
jgi:hypothetical protein